MKYALAFFTLLLVGCRSVERNLTVRAESGSTVTITAAGDASQEAAKDYGRAFSGNDAAVSLPVK